MLLGEEGCGSPGVLVFGYPYVNGTNDAYFNPSTDHFGKFHAGGTAVVYCDGHAKISRAEANFIATVCGIETICF
jgi:prepilin-type processing-associated H-X9-DG protein